MAKATATIKGLDKVMANLNKKVNAIEVRTVGGLMAAGLKVQRLSQQRVPVEYGNLKGSAYTRKALENALAVTVGYSAAYAVFVHENMEQKLKGTPRPSGLGVYWGPHGQPKFLESAARDLSAEIVATVAAHARKSTAA